ncbi:TPA: hypothetical protein HA244_05245 [Candidatus Micrarchaeota archaeon]|nr:hypothetical protein [Candidatus Micrarchaeota archaeon]
MKNEYLVYAMLFVGVLLLAWSAFSTFAKPQLDRDARGLLLETQANEQYFQQQALQVGNECGNLNDEANVQHLSHHPSQFADCLKQVDPAFLQKATGKTLGQIIG